ncbi:MULTISPECIES: polysaccharide biosynthesis/export family protein [unclassified Yoonia]|uniref:polysaccharide biosynthesis/export family protein n=1 Tax=unclassified Yoonia TaxID=2629118 RepID=UPI002AFEE5EF|nr:MULTISPECIES: polysaccharide biosynthesis/export family protein [unclassified Yoonia]
MFQRMVAAAACLSLMGCGLPRGAGFQSEVLAAANTNIAARGETPAYDFAIYPVNSETLPMLRSWPSRNLPATNWLTATEQPASLLIAPGDLVQLTIWDAEENSLLAGVGQRATALQEVQVSAGGQIFVPYIGDLRVAGMSAEAARAQIEEQLVPTIPSAQVQLFVQPGRNNSANITGGVGALGLYEIPDRNFRILDLLSKAGGATPTFNNPQVRLTRGGQVYSVPLQRLLDEPQLDIAMRGGDRVQVVPDDRSFLALGATGSQAVVDFTTSELSALQAMALLGGVSAASANPKGVLILREYDWAEVRDGISGPPQQRIVFTMDLTTADGLFSAGKFLVQDGDLVYGTESPLGVALSAFRVATTLQSVVN